MKTVITIGLVLVLGGSALGVPVPIDVFDGTINSWGLTFAGPGSDGVFSFQGVLAQMDTDGMFGPETYEAYFSNFIVDVSTGVNMGGGVWEYNFVNSNLVDGFRVYDGPVNGVLDGDYASFDIMLNSLRVVGESSGIVNWALSIDIILNTNNSTLFDFTPFQQGGDFVMTIQIAGQGLPGLLTALQTGTDIPPGNSGTSGSFSAAAGVVPEPASISLILAGIAAAAYAGRKKS